MAGAGDCGTGVVGAGIAVVGGVDDQCQRHRVEAEQAVEIVLKLGALLRAVENQDDLGSASAVYRRVDGEGGELEAQELQVLVERDDDRHGGIGDRSAVADHLGRREIGHQCGVDRGDCRGDAGFQCRLSDEGRRHAAEHGCPHIGGVQGAGRRDDVDPAAGAQQQLATVLQDGSGVGTAGEEGREAGGRADL